MEVTSRLNNLRIAPRKVRLVAELLKGMSVEDAVAQLRFMSKNCAAPMSKLIRAAAADAEHNFKLVKAGLIVKRVIVESSTTFKRYTPKAYGRAGEIRRRGSNVIVTLVGSEPVKEVVEEKKPVKKPRVKKETK
jgi:large subunit ribosomal protein L22